MPSRPAERRSTMKDSKRSCCVDALVEECLGWGFLKRLLSEDMLLVCGWGCDCGCYIGVCVEKIGVRGIVGFIYMFDVGGCGGTRSGL